MDNQDIPPVSHAHEDNSKTSSSSMPTSRRLTRSKSNQVIAGVAAGLANYFSVDPVIVRILFVLITVWGGSGILIYVILWMLMPLEDSETSSTGQVVKLNSQELKQKAEAFASELETMTHTKNNTALWGGIILLLIGVYFLFGNLGFFNIFSFLRPGTLWPVVLILVGIILLIKQNDR